MVFYRRHWLSTWLWLLAGWLIDLDHLLAYPDYAPERCSIGSHPLHTPPTIAIYGLFVFPRRSRLLGLGLLIHTGLDAFDCLLM